MLKDTRATTVNTAYRNFEPGKVLDIDSSFYVDPLDHNGAYIKQQLILTDSAQQIKWFFMGHRGCGKSSLLKRIIYSEEVQEKYYPILFNVPDVVDLNDITHQDIVFAMCARAFEIAASENIVSQDLQNRFMEWGRSVSEEISKEEGAGISVSGGANAGFAKFVANLRSKYSNKLLIRKQFEPRITDLIEILNHLCDEIQTSTNRPVLIVIDDIDKITPDAAKDIFGKNLALMRLPKCFIIYTVPVSLMHADEWHALMDHYWYLPNIKLHDKDNRENRHVEGYEKMREFFSKRASEQIIDDIALDRCIKFGGGVFRQTCRIIQRAIMFAIMRGGRTVSIEDVNRSVDEYANGMVPQLTQADMLNLASIFTTRDVITAYSNPKLLFSMSALIYPDGKDWVDVNPVLWNRMEGYVDN